VFVAIQLLFIGLFAFIVIQQRRLGPGNRPNPLPEKEKLYSG